LLGGENEEFCLKFLANLGDDFIAVDVCIVMAEQNIFVADGDDVVVEDPGVDGRGALAREYDSIRVELMAASDRCAGVECLAGGKASDGPLGISAVDEDFDACAAVAFAKPHVVGGAFVGVSFGGGQWIVVREKVAGWKDRFQDRRGDWRFERAVKLRDEIRGREMDALIGGVGAGGNSCGVGGPHR